MGKFLRENATLIALVVLGVFLAFYNEFFFSPRNLSTMALQLAPTGIIAVGMTMVILIAGIDLSVGSVLALSAIVGAWLIQEAGLSAPFAILLTLVGGVLVGGWNGFWTAHYKIPSFIITLGMMTIARGLAHRISNSSSIPIPNETFSKVANSFISPTISTVIFISLWALMLWRTLHDIQQRRKYQLDVHLREKVFELGTATVGIGLALYIFASHRGIPYPVAIFAVVAIAGVYTLRNTKFGRRLYAIGGNEEAARLSGVNVRITTLLVFVIVGVLSALGGIIQASRLDSATPNLGIMLELDVITAVVIGGTSLAGGSGTVGGTVVGVFLIGVLANGMSLESIDTNYQNIIKGLIITLAAWFDVVSKLKKS